MGVAIKPEDFHHLLAHATCCVTEGATTASEACMLGTPVLYLNPLQPCYIHTLADTGLLEKALPGEDMTAALKRLRQRFPNAAAAHQAAERLVQSHIDVTAFVTAFIEDFGA